MLSSGSLLWSQGSGLQSCPTPGKGAWGIYTASSISHWLRAASTGYTSPVCLACFAHRWGWEGPPKEALRQVGRAYTTKGQPEGIWALMAPLQSQKVNVR